MRTTTFALLACLLLGCSSEEAPSATILLSPGQEVDAFTRDPVPQRLVLHAVSTAGQSEQILDSAWPDGGFDIGEYEPDQVVAFEAFGRDATGQTVLRGATIYHPLWAIDGARVPVFMGRVGELSRPSGKLSITREDALAAIVDARFIVTAGGSGVRDADGGPVAPATFSAYDLGWWTPSGAQRTLPRSPASLAMVQGRYALVIDGQGASWFDFATYEVTEAEAPNGVSFADVAGGDVVYADDGSSYVVGPTRTDAPSSVVLHVGLLADLTAIRLPEARQGCAATYVPDRGLVVAGGHAAESGALIVPPDGTAFSALPYPPDPVQGAGAAPLGDDRLLIAGGLDGSAPAPPRVLDLSCMAECEASEIGVTASEVGIGDAWVRATAPGEAVVVGPHGTEDTTCFVRLTGLDATPAAQEVALREPRTGATPISIFGRAVAIVGGRKTDGTGAKSIEVYIPKAME